MSEIEPDVYEESRVLHEITEGRRRGEEFELIRRAIAERWVNVIHRLLHVDKYRPPSGFNLHQRLLEPFWVGLTDPYLSERITKEFLRYNISFLNRRYEVSANDSYKRLVALHDSGVFITDPNNIIRRSMFFQYLLIVAGKFPENGVVNLRELFPLPRSLQHTCKLVVRLSLSACTRKRLKKRVYLLPLPKIIKDYILSRH